MPFAPCEEGQDGEERRRAHQELVEVLHRRMARREAPVDEHRDRAGKGERVEPPRKPSPGRRRRMRDRLLRRGAARAHEHEAERPHEDEQAARRHPRQPHVLHALEDREVERRARVWIRQLFIGTLVDPPSACDERMVDGNRDRRARRAVRLDLGLARVLPHGARVRPAVDRERAHREVEALCGRTFRDAARLSRPEAQIAVLRPGPFVVGPAAQHEREAHVEAERRPSAHGTEGGEQTEPRDGGDAPHRHIPLHERERPVRTRARKPDRQNRADEQHPCRRASSRHALPELPEPRHDARAPVRSRAAAKPCRAQ